VTVYKVGPSFTKEPKRKGISNKEELDKFKIELCYSKSRQKFLEDQLFKENKMKALLNQ
jgi:hypothetical protein